MERIQADLPLGIQASALTNEEMISERLTALLINHDANMPAVYMEYHNKAWQTGTSVLSLDWKSKKEMPLRLSETDRETETETHRWWWTSWKMWQWWRKRKCSNPSWRQHQEGGTWETGEISGAEWSAGEVILVVTGALGAVTPKLGWLASTGPRNNIWDDLQVQR